MFSALRNYLLNASRSAPKSGRIQGQPTPSPVSSAVVPVPGTTSNPPGAPMEKALQVNPPRERLNNPYSDLKKGSLRALLRR